MDGEGERQAGGARGGSAPRWLAGIPRRIVTIVGVIVAILIIIGVGRLVANTRGWIAGIRGRTTLSQEMVVEQVRAVAKLVSSEMTVRDVVTYENTRYGSTKRALIVVTGKILAGIDLERGTEVRIDSSRRHITIIIPEAQVLAVDIEQLRTYDEQRGLWNPFQPEDRDAIYQNVRRQLHRTAADMGIVQRANVSAARMLETMFSVDGYTTEVRFGAPAPALDGPRRDTAGQEAA
jgi:hypothetical protein